MAHTLRKGVIKIVETDNGKIWQVYIDGNGDLQIEEVTL